MIAKKAQLESWKRLNKLWKGQEGFVRRGEANLSKGVTPEQI
jgi:hypothetical protein